MTNETPDISKPLSSWMPTIVYPGYIPGLPDLVVGRWPSAFERSVPIKVWIVCTSQEMLDLLSAVNKPVPMRGDALDFSSGPDAIVSSPVKCDNFCALYVPPALGWPWITLTSLDMPKSVARGFVRNRFAWDVDDTEADAMRRITHLGTLSPNMSDIRFPGGVITGPAA